MNKKKIINDPVYGFISIPSGFIFDLIQHPYFQRLRYIKQVSMTHLVYPGALHTRFQHALGAMHLMGLALETLRGKGVAISEEEEEAALVAILLHDVGHGPFSHSLEHTLVEGVSHEWLSSLMMNELNETTAGRLDLAIEVFNNRYPKKFLYQLVSGQLDIDRMDYLSRDSFFTGVAEGVISFDRIIKMLNVVDNELVVEQKGIYSIEKFLIARRLMYWQVYLHKTVLSAEQMLLKILQRAKELYGVGHSLFASPSLEHFLRNKVTRQNFTGDALHLVHFLRLDDTDIWSAVKTWAHHSDGILQRLCAGLVARSLYHTELHAVLPGEEQLAQLRAEAVNHFDIDGADVDYYVWVQSIENSAYEPNNGTIKILMKDGSIQDIAEASDLSNLETLSRKVQKFAVSFPKELVHTPLSIH
ncbi:HD domain-containing protein [Parapedobacter sp. 10938]|uniref:HD domain-containing protein n=1 Tax=Parapedobacter flavus TaxID=3110225 RepID=UPI002DBEE37E|nr:HD domain-containing protein [Parapedobacter sp. 10938]MEC3879257.1 HD domain-containing protein [Parapedobacter sp. 10938]